jgi:hypothetical protein
MGARKAPPPRDDGKQIEGKIRRPVSTRGYLKQFNKLNTKNAPNAMWPPTSLLIERILSGCLPQVDIRCL